MEKFVIEGGVPLSGTMVPAGNKNGALPILASSLLTEDEVTVRNVPRIRDVEAMLSILRAIGVEVSWRGANEVVLCAASVHAVDELCGFILACAYVRPQGLHGMTAKSVKKKLRAPSFAAAVDRDELRRAADELGVDFDEHLAFVIDALAQHADDLVPASPTI